MSQILLSGHTARLPNLLFNSASSFTTITLNATGETCCMIGAIILQNPLSAAKTISAAGGGSIVWRSGAVTFSDAGSTFEVGLQDVSITTSPAQGDGTFDVKASFTGGGGGITANTTQTSVMTTGTKSISNGQLVSINFNFTARAGSDSVQVNANNVQAFGVTPSRPTVVDNTVGSYTRPGNAGPNAYIVFDDGTIGWIYGVPYLSSAGTSVAFNSGTATADEYGNLINIPASFMAIGLEVYISPANTSSDFEFILYSDPLGTPVAERTITVDATQLGGTSSIMKFSDLFTTPFLVKSNTNFVAAVRPTTANQVTLYYAEGLDSNSGKTGYPSTNFYSVRRLDNSGAFSDYNGGTAKTRVMYINLIGSHIEKGGSQANYQLGL